MTQTLAVKRAASLDRFLRMTPIQVASQRWTRNRLAVLAYHAIIDPDRFEDHLLLLRRRMRPISLAEATSAIREQRSLPERSVLVTFDDGDRSVLDVALPLLREHGIPAVVCVVASLLGTDRPFWWDEAIDLWEMGGRSERSPAVDGSALVRLMKRMADDDRRTALEDLRRTAAQEAPRRRQLTSPELRELESKGVDIANHTLTHPCLPNCSRPTVESEIREAHDVLRSALGHSPAAFAYPNGDRDERAEDVLRDLGYDVAFLFDHRLNPRSISDPMALSRLRVNSHTSLDRFEIILSGLHPAIHHALGRP